MGFLETCLKPTYPFLLTFNQVFFVFTDFISYGRILF